VSAPGPLTAGLTWSPSLSSYNLSPVRRFRGVPCGRGSALDVVELHTQLQHADQPHLLLPEELPLTACIYTSGSNVTLTTTYPVTTTHGLELFGIHQARVGDDGSQAGVYKIPDLLGPLGNGVRPQALVGAACAFVAAYLSTKFPVKFFETRSLLPFGIYCPVAGGLCILRFA
jgi:hypothetical protein